MSSAVDLPGAAHLVLATDVTYLEPETAAFTAMVDGWALQQRTRFLNPATISSRLTLVRRVAAFTNEYPWRWQAADVEAFIDGCRNQAQPIVPSTGRLYEQTLRMFLDYATDPRYGWPATCLERFGVAPVQVLHEWNTVAHVSEFEGQPGRRPLTYDEVQALFDAADGRVGRARSLGRKGALVAMRDAAVLKTVYAYGLRRREAWGLDVADLRHNPKVPRFGRFGGVFVRWGKSSRGSAPKRHTVLTVPEMDWVLPVLEQWLGEVRPGFVPGKHAGLWVTERAGRLSMRSINEAFASARDAAGLPEELDLHCLRHSYITHLVEFDYAEKFVQDQAGHAFASTTGLYTAVSDDYRNRALARALRRYPELWDEPGEKGRP